VGKAGNLLLEMMDILGDRLGERINEFIFPPPIFNLMQGEILELDLEAGFLTARFPILESYLNPYGVMQGGMITAAVDNTIGPLSVLVAPSNVTRNLEMKFSQPVKPELEYILVKARLLEQKKRRLFFEAEVCSPEGRRLAKCKAVHWIIESNAD